MKKGTIFLVVLVLIVAGLLIVVCFQAQSNLLHQSSALSIPQAVPTSPSWFEVIIDFIQSLFPEVVALLRNPVAVVSAFVISLLIVRLIGRLCIAIWEAGGKLGPVLIVDVSNTPEVAILIRQYFVDCGGTCSRAPNPTPGIDDISTELAAIDDSSAKLAAVILNVFKFLLGALSAGYTVSYNLTGDEDKPPVSIYVEITMTHNGKILESKKLTANSTDEVAKSAAYWIFWYLSERKSIFRSTPPWNSFPSFDGFLYYEMAKAKAEVSDLRQANQLFKKAAAEAPFNALVHLDWGDINETHNQYVKALEIYMEVVSMWPHLYGFWYRVAAIFSCPEAWVDEQWNILKDEDQNRLQKHIVKLFDDNNLKYSKDAIERNDMAGFYQLAMAIWIFLNEQINAAFGLWFVQVFNEPFSPIGYNPDMALYYWKLIPLFGWQEGRQFLRSVLLAKYCTQIQCENLDNQKIACLNKNVQTNVESYWNPVDVYYNAACYYSQLSKMWRNENNSKYISDALENLKLAFKDTTQDTDLVWVQNDPDFEPLHNDSEYIALFVEPNKKELENESDEEKEKREKLNALYALMLGARQQKKDWEAESRQSLSAEALITKAEYQIDLCNSLIEFCKNPCDQSHKDLFWQLVMQKIAPDDIPNNNLKDTRSASLEDIDKTWKTIADCVQPHLGSWKKRRKNSKLFLRQHGHSDMRQVLEEWAQSEVKWWIYLSQQARRVLTYR